MYYRDLALKYALKEVGVREIPANTNDGPRVKQYQSVTGAYRAPWCASFVEWCFVQAGLKELFAEKSAYVPYFVQQAKVRGWAVAKPAPGDLACFDWNKDGVSDHIGFVVDVLGTKLLTVEGNTAKGNDSNGGQVMKRDDRTLSQVAMFIRVPGVHPDPPKPKKKIRYVLKRRTFRNSGRRTDMTYIEPK